MRCRSSVAGVLVAPLLAGCWFGAGPGPGDPEACCSADDPEGIGARFAGRADLEVRWTIAGSTDAARCDEQGVAQVHVLVTGPQVAEVSVPCGSAWGTRRALFGLLPGAYDVTLTARDHAGAPRAERLQSVELRADPETIWTVDIDIAVDETPLADGGRLEVHWRINGTVDGSATGTSWDTCDEVGATAARLVLDGEERFVQCAAMGVCLDGLALGAHEVSLALVGADRAPLTTEAAGSVSVGLRGGEFIGDFYFDAFFEPLRSAIRGDYAFIASLSGKPCASAAAGVRVRVTRDGVEVPAQVCAAAGDPCAAADGLALWPCASGSGQARLVDLSWGIYELELTAEGAEGACFETRDPPSGGRAVQILVGAGLSNPVVTHELVQAPGDAC